MKSIHFSIHASHKHLLNPLLCARHLLGARPGEGHGGCVPFWDADVKGNKIEAISWRSSQESVGESQGGGVLRLCEGLERLGKGFPDKGIACIGRSYRLCWCFSRDPLWGHCICPTAAGYSPSFHLLRPCQVMCLARTDTS